MKQRIALALLLIGGFAGVAHAVIHCATADLNQYTSQVRHLPSEQMIRTHSGEHPMTPPANPNVGDSWLWYTWRLNGPPTPELKMCTVRGEGSTVYVVVENSQWLTRVFQDDIDAIVNAWDNASIGQWPNKGIYELDTTNFGPAPDMLDNDPKIYVLFYDFDISADGFFWAFDEYPDGTQPYESNECEVVYINSSDNDPGGSFLISVMAHEFHHMIHWLADEDEAAWVNEGMAELAMWIYGDPDPIVQFPNNPDNDLTAWNGAFADYIKTYLWSLYFYEQLGGQPAVWALVHEPGNSTTGYETVLDQLGSPLNFADVYANWTCANYLDNTSIAQGQYGYRGETLPPFNAVTKSSYPVPPTNGTVLRYAADYVKFVSGIPQLLRFDGTDIGVWRPRVLFLNGGVAKHVADIPLDAVDFGTIPIYGFGTNYDTVVLVVAKTSPSSTTSYQYATENPNPASVVDPASSSAFGLSPGVPNPMRGPGTVLLTLGGEQQVAVSVYDPAGRMVRKLASENYPAGEHTIVWDGRDDEGRPAPAGIYFVRAHAEDATATARWIRIE